MSYSASSIRRIVVLPFTACVAIIALTGCNTFHGAGQDIASVGRGIENAADGDHYGAYVTQRVYLRGGPGAKFPRVDAVRRGDSIEVHGCLTRRDWCDVSSREGRGWIPANRISFRDGDRRLTLNEYDSRRSLNTIRFSYGYWDSNYTSRPWYKDKASWELRYRYDN